MKRLSSILAVSVLAGVLAGCATKEYVEIAVPIRCDIELPPRPNQGKNNYDTIRDILIYTELLEKAIRVCKGE